MIENSLQHQAMQAYNTTEWIKYLQDPENLRKLKLGFARVGVFGAETSLDFLQQIRSGIKTFAVEKEFWTMERWGVNDPIVLKRLKRSIVKRDGHHRKNSFYYKRATVCEQVAPVQFTAHSMAKYRERALKYIDPTTAWMQLPKLPTGVELGKDGAPTRVRKDIMLPIGEGAFLGQPLICDDTVMHYEFTHKRGCIKTETQVPPMPGFRCWTYIHKRQMNKAQKQILRLYQQDRQDEAVELMKETRNENQIDEHENFNIIEYEYPNKHTVN